MQPSLPKKMDVNFVPNYSPARSMTEVNQLGRPVRGRKANAECNLFRVFDELSQSKGFSILLSLVTFLSVFNFVLVYWLLTTLHLGSVSCHHLWISRITRYPLNSTVSGTVTLHWLMTESQSSQMHTLKSGYRVEWWDHTILKNWFFPEEGDWP